MDDGMKIVRLEGGYTPGLIRGSLCPLLFLAKPAAGPGSSTHRPYSNSSIPAGRTGSKRKSERRACEAIRETDVAAA